LKLHGDCRRPDTRVLLTTEYEEAYVSDGAVHEELALLYKKNSMLFLGSSLGSDRTVQLIAEIAREDTHMPKHFAFLAFPSDKDEYKNREHFLTQHGIYPIWYNNSHDESIMSLLAGLLNL